MDQRQTQTRLAHALRPDRCRNRDRVNARLPDHAVQSADAAHDGSLLPDAALVAIRNNPGLTGDSHTYGRTMVRWSLVESSLHADSSRADTRCDVAGATEPLRVDVQSAAESRVRKSRRCFVRE